jgi:hypothetical protein
MHEGFILPQCRSKTAKAENAIKRQSWRQAAHFLSIIQIVSMNFSFAPEAKRDHQANPNARFCPVQQTGRGGAPANYDSRCIVRKVATLQISSVAEC